MKMYSNTISIVQQWNFRRKEDPWYLFIQALFRWHEQTLVLGIFSFLIISSKKWSQAPWWGDSSVSKWQLTWTSSYELRMRFASPSPRLERLLLFSSSVFQRGRRIEFQFQKCNQVHRRSVWTIPTRWKWSQQTPHYGQQGSLLLLFHQSRWTRVSAVWRLFVSKKK